MRTVDFSPLYRTIVGFDRLANMMDTASKLEGGSGYPPYNIEQTDENEFRIELAVAGFSEDDLELEVQENVLTVAGKRDRADEDTSRTFLHRGIAERGFERRFHLADHVQVRDAELKHGMLTVRLEREVPEAKKPRQIAINGQSKSGAKLIQGGKKSAA
ncbi:heat-shock protein IbpA [Marinicauda pacifica]|jgi:molecular chaperone IbpA|uniref:Hsp20 family protein n=1 Tax=Marinicauda pacifica TaxID=1133559 RepID=A0A4S2H8H9_9PROT|nr:MULTISPECIES: Hsp20 family protein [Marinicauda]TGY92130.1 Hsp20 family protein [Marinicauda pacifica]GGE46218.1 heat-shock protein IbpA [Marinicauda pacifica]